MPVKHICWQLQAHVVPVIWPATVSSCFARTIEIHLCTNTCDVDGIHSDGEILWRMVHECLIYRQLVIALIHKLVLISTVVAKDVQQQVRDLQFWWQLFSRHAKLPPHILHTTVCIVCKA